MGFFENLFDDMVLTEIKNELRHEIETKKKFSYNIGLNNCPVTSETTYFFTPSCVQADIDFAREHGGLTQNQLDAKYLEDHFDEIVQERFNRMKNAKLFTK